MLQGGLKLFGSDEIVRRKERQVHLEGGAMGIEERTAVAVAQFTLLRRARQVRPNATECTATLRSVHADPTPRPLRIAKGLASHPGQHAEVTNKREK